MLPKKLFHYTSIETLALIIKYKKFRFTRLSLLNDPLEGKSSDLAKTEELVYCSSWSANPIDTIPMWKMYTDLKGVRLSVSSDSIFASSRPSSMQNFGSQVSPVTILQEPITVNNVSGHKMPLPIQRVFGPEEVKYLNDIEAQKVKTTQSITDCTSGKPVNRKWIKLDGVGLNKDICWEYEKEWRFRLTTHESTIPVEQDLEQFVNFLTLEHDFIDVPVSESFWENLEILMGPMCNEGQFVLLESLLNSYGIKANIIRSKIQIK